MLLIALPRRKGGITRAHGNRILKLINRAVSPAGWAARCASVLGAPAGGGMGHRTKHSFSATTHRFFTVITVTWPSPRIVDIWPIRQFPKSPVTGNWTMKGRSQRTPLPSRLAFTLAAQFALTHLC